MIGVVGTKKGMTRVFTDSGVSIPVTVILIEKNRITQIKSLKKEGYASIQITTGLKKRSRLKKSESGFFSKINVEAGRGLWEFKTDEQNKFLIGQNIDVNIFVNVKKVDITGVSKGKGFSGTIKRWHFSSQDATHGNSLSHRVPGSIGQNQTPGKVFKGKKMAGQLGNTRVTIQNLKIVQIDTNNNLLLVQGGIPGAKNSNVIIKPSIKNFEKKSLGETD